VSYYESRLETTDALRISRATIRRLFLALPPALRAQTRGRVQSIINAEIARGQKQPSELARQLALGVYDEPEVRRDA
jgi:hypothetical protein